ncbi:hypothetical protein GCM10022223_15160 [Kineosporia mesophila]|uniref:Glycosyltransferase RgtA/B/C/D-like domain-containing protein n=1 Tax=Kineosporia mesophila TaxID=566012 RepID=A0ABP6ZCY0_9ACTN|nr:hypothetical protein [Kineosporia mesophila]MCD5352991.1 hypothetical protein [Kineosporia mesophila]
MGHPGSTAPAAWTRLVPGLLAFAVALALTAWALHRPALWLDEAASAVAARRSWPDLWQLWGGTDAPLMPYYLVLKFLSATASFVDPRLTAHPEVLLRWPSALAAAGAVGVLVAWLRTVLPAVPALGCGAVLMAFGDFSRYGQEARPYALVLLLAVSATALWWRLMRTESLPTTVAYALCVAALTSLHLLSAMLVPAHLAAALLVRDRARRQGSDPLMLILLLSSAVLAALLLAGPAVVAAVTFGGGASRYHPLTGGSVLTMVAALVGGIRPFVAVATLAALGITRWRHERDADLTRIAVCWSFVPWLFYLPAVIARPNLLIGRYLLFTTPGWAILAGLGLLTLAGTAVAARTVALGAAVALLILLQWPALEAVRAPAGHGRDVRPMATLLRRPAYRDLPLIVPTSTDMLQLTAYAPDAAGRVGNQVLSSVNVWPDRLGRTAALRRLAGARSVVLIVRTGACGPMPLLLDHFRVDSATPAGSLTAMVLTRPPDLVPPRGFRHPTPGLPPRLILPCPDEVSPADGPTGS